MVDFAPTLIRECNLDVLDLGQKQVSRRDQDEPSSPA
jgi:hypothetical protein